MDPDPASFDPILLSQVRLGVVSVLMTRGSATFPELRDLLELTQGNLSVHLRKLEEAGYVGIAKDFVDRKPRTTATLTRRGRSAFLAHVETLARIARDAT